MHVEREREGEGEGEGEGRERGTQHSWSTIKLAWLDCKGKL